MEKIMTPAEVAEAMQLNRRTVYKLLESGELRGRKVGRVWRIPQSAVNEYMGGGGKVHWSESRSWKQNVTGEIGSCLRSLGSRGGRDYSKDRTGV